MVLKRKGVSPLVGYVLVTGIILAGTGIVLSMGTSMIEDMRDTAAIQESLSNMNEIDSLIDEVASGGKHTTRTYSLRTSRGSYYIDEDKNSLMFEIGSESDIVSSGAFRQVGSALLTANIGVNVYNETINGEECYMIENQNLEACIKSIDQEAPEEIDNSDLLVHYKNKDIGDLDPDLEVYFDDNKDTMTGDTYTEPQRMGEYLGRGTVEANVDTGSIQYIIRYTLYPDSDFLKVEVDSPV